MQTAIQRKETNVDIKQTLVKLYFEGKSRKEAMMACDFDLTWDNNRMSGLSSRLKLDWRVPPENRQSGKKPAPQKSASKAKVPAPAKGKSSAVLASKPSAQAVPKVPSAETEKTLDPRRLKPSPSFSSARERRERGIDDRRFDPPSSHKEDEAERYLNQYYAKKFG